MKTLLAALTCAVVLAGLTQDARAQEDPTFGLGVGLSSSGFGSGDFDVIESVLGPTSLYMPITFTTFRIEPEIGLFRVSNEDGDIETSSTSFQIGTGVFLLNPIASTIIYYGGRLGITRQSTAFETPAGDGEESRTNFFIGPAAGGEYLFSDHFSLGGEGQLMFTSLGDDDDDVDESSSVLRTRGVFFVRWHF